MYTYFTVGPSEIYPTVFEHYKTAFEKQYGSISHRSAQFRKIYQHTDEQLRQLLQIPSETALLFLGSATEIWERIIQNTVQNQSFHLVNGSFSKKFSDFSKQLKKEAISLEKPLGEGFNDEEIIIPEKAEIVCCTANETSTGVQFSGSSILKLKQKYTDKLFFVDMVSAYPHMDLDLNFIDSAFFSVQKGFGMPAGLGVWLVNSSCRERAEKLSKTQSIGTYHTLPSLYKNYQNFENACTPNVLGIYVLGKVAEDMNQEGGLSVIQKNTVQKASKIYDWAEKNPLFEIFVTHKKHRSETVIVLNTKKPSSEIISKLKEKNIVVGSGYGTLKETQIRIANFPALTLEKVEELLENLSQLK